MNSPDDYIKVHVKVTGMVHGVGFRYWTLKHAQRLGLGGSVLNLPDGSVEVVFCGEDCSVEEMIQLCGRGPAYARVDNLAMLGRWSVAVCPEAFRILR